MTFRISAVEIRLGFPFIAAMTLLLFIDKSGRCALTISAAILHECGHIFALFLFKDIPGRIVFMPFGMKIIRNGQVGISYQKEIITALSGPVINIICAAVFLISEELTHNKKLLVPAAINIGLAILNLLPICDMDGERIIFNILSDKKDPVFAKKIIEKLSFIFVIGIVFAGICQIYFNRKFSIAAVSLYAIFLHIHSVKQNYFT